ncbi:hypothetical protein Egran_03469 [Elaphomyces granulatus]|uniref:Imidazoleglycerol-phosphate dehydratase n=1 Tax=Elaphomyces granulatus TaxID=519963 RepID=A0A232LXK9_9EURO|nr:hypothetical protein Egran_03469 [Elaphomyces granulatus]
MTDTILFLTPSVDDYHTTEDTFLALGTAFTQTLGPRTSLVRFGRGDAVLDSALSWAVIDLSNRPYSVTNIDFRREMTGEPSTENVAHGLESFAQVAGVTVHVGCTYESTDHRKAESTFKALAMAVRTACERRTAGEVGAGDVVSTKGVVKLDVFEQFDGLLDSRLLIDLLHAYVVFEVLLW